MEQIASVISTNLVGAFHVAIPAFRAMQAQGYGRLVFTSSGAGLFGARNEANYAAAKAGLLGLSATLAIEGSSYEIKSNVIAPNASTRMAEGIRPQDIDESVRRQLASRARTDASSPEFVTPCVIYLASEECAVTQEVFSAVRGRFARVFTAVTSGWRGPLDQPTTPEDIQHRMHQIRDMSSYHVPKSVYEELVFAGTASADSDSAIPK